VFFLNTVYIVLYYIEYNQTELNWIHLPISKTLVSAVTNHEDRGLIKYDDDVDPVTTGTTLDECFGPVFARVASYLDWIWAWRRREHITASSHFWLTSWRSGNDTYAEDSITLMHCLYDTATPSQYQPLETTDVTDRLLIHTTLQGTWCQYKLRVCVWTIKLQVTQFVSSAITSSYVYNQCRHPDSITRQTHAPSILRITICTCFDGHHYQVVSC